MTTDEEPTDNPAAAEDSNGTGLWAIASAVLLGLVLLAGAWAVLGPGPDGGPAPEPEQTGNGASDGQTAGDGGCPAMPEGDDDDLSRAPQVTWRIDYTIAFPYSDDHGPAVVQDDIARCFSRTPTGALIAGRHISSRMIASPAGADVARTQTVPGPGQDRMVAALVERGAVTPEPGQLCQTAGYRLSSWSAERAVFQIASRCPGAGLQLTESTLVWVDGDWRLELLEDGSSSPTAAALSNLGGMTAWGGV